MGVDRKCIHMMQTEQADTVRYLGSNPLYGAQRRVRFRIGHGAQCIQRVRLCKVRACGTQVFRAVAQAKGAQRFRLRRRQCKRIHFHTFGAFDMLVDGEPVHFRSGKAKELMALCVYRDGRPVSIHEIVENLWGENADGTGYRRTIKELADTLRDYGAEEMFLRSRGSLRVRMDLADSDFQAFMSGDEDAICQFQGVFMQQYSWAEPMVCTLQEKKELMLARMGKHRM